MSRQYNVAVAGATGAVGLEMIQTLEKRKFPVKNLRLFASERSVGKKLAFCGQKIAVELLKGDVFKGTDFALFSAGTARSRSAFGSFARSPVASWVCFLKPSPRDFFWIR